MASLTVPPIATVTADGTAATYTLSIPAGSYPHLTVIAEVAGTTGIGLLQVQFNGDSGAHYTTEGTGNRDGQTSLFWGVVAAANSGPASVFVSDIPLFASTTFYKYTETRSLRNDSLKFASAAVGGRWQSTAAITSITVTLGAGGNFASGSRIDVYAVGESIPAATSSTLGVVQPDNTTITVNSSGVLSASGGGGGSEVVTDGTTTVTGVSTIAFTGATVSAGITGTADVAITPASMPGGGGLVLIGNQSVGFSATCTVSGIPPGYTSLLVLFNGNSSGSSTDALYLQFNGDTGPRYFYRYSWNNGSGFSATQATFASELQVLQAYGTKLMVLNAQMMGYDSYAGLPFTTQTAVVDPSGFPQPGIGSGYWSADVPVTSITAGMVSGATFQNAQLIVLGVSAGSGVGSTFAWKTITANYTPSKFDTGILVDATSGSITVTLPDASTTTQPYTIKRIDTSSNTVTIATTSGQTIDGASTQPLSAQYDSITLASDGTNYFIPSSTTI